MIVLGLVTNMWFADGVAVAFWYNYSIHSQNHDQKLKSVSNGQIAMESHDKLQEYHAMIERHHPALPDVWGTMDGLKIKIDEALDDITQSCYTLVGSTIILRLLLFFCSRWNDSSMLLQCARMPP